jgi:predicted component of type VI protein secretion system
MIVIRVVSQGGSAPPAPLSAIFGEAGGDIGRGAECTLVLVDTQRRISRRQLHVSWRDGAYFIRQIGAGLELAIDEQALQPDVEYPLLPGTDLRIGEYRLRVEAMPADAGDSLALLRPRGVGARPGAFADLLGAEGRGAPHLAADEIDLVVGEPTAAGPRADPLAALFAGLGVTAPAQPSAPQLHALGEMLREMVGGTVELLAARSLAKREFGAGQTLLRTRENNPLKFSPDADAALALLLNPPQGGFLAPAQAAREAHADLRAHHLAMLSGMRAALDAVLARFDPTALEQRLTREPGLWDALLPAGRRAKLWERYAERYTELLREVEGDFDGLFGRAFLQAYKAQLAALAAEPEVRGD